MDWHWFGIWLILGWRRICTGLETDWSDWHRTGDRLAMNWHLIEFGTAMDCLKIGIRLALDWHQIGMDWRQSTNYWYWIGDGLAGLTSDWQRIWLGIDGHRIGMDWLWIDIRLALNWKQIGTSMVGLVSDRHRIGRMGRMGDELSLDEIGMGRHLDGNRLMMDCRISDGLTDWWWIDGLLMNWWIGPGLTLDWRFGDRLTLDWHGLVMDWH